MGATRSVATVTFLFTDVEGSTKLLRELGPEQYADLLAGHREVVRRASRANDGVEMGTEGDACFLAFPSATGAVAAAATITDELAAGPIRVRIGLHTGAPLATGVGYVGEDVHLVARIAAAGHGGQVLVSAVTAALVDGLAQSSSLCDLGEHRLKDIDGPISIFQLGRGAFPPLKTISNSNLPRPASTFIGRQRELEDVLDRLGSGARLVTLTGPGGSGKTRLALEAASSVVADHRAGVFWVGLESLRDASLVSATIAQVLGARDGLVEHIRDRDLLLVVDNLEQVIEAAPELAALVAACPNLALLVTSRELLRVRGEVEFAVPPLDEADAVALFCERAIVEPSADIGELCRRVDALPLAVELAAARTTALTPAQILGRLSRRLDLLAGGRDVDPRHQTLRSTIEWSYDLLDATEQQLFRRLAVFAGGCTLEAAEAVCAADLDTMQSLVEKSLLRFANGRYWMLDTIREFAAERLDSSDLNGMRWRHRAYVVSLAEASAHHLHTADEGAVSARLAPDYPNIRAVVLDALDAGEPNDVGRIVGAVYPFLISHGHPAEVLEWVERALAARDRLSERGLAEALVGGGEIARFAGELTRAIELKEELASFESDLQRPNWRASTLADLCEIALDQGDLERARTYAAGSAAAGGGARATLCFAELSLRLGELEDAEADAIAALAAMERGEFNHACGLEVLGEIARRAGDGVRAGDCFRDALRSFRDLGDGGGIADCLDGLSRLADAAGDDLRAGRLQGAAQRLRETRGRRPIRTDVPLPDVVSRARDEGRAKTLEEAIAFALGG